MLFRKIFESLHAAMAILARFKSFSSKFCLHFLTLILSTSPNILLAHFRLCVLKA